MTGYNRYKMMSNELEPKPTPSQPVVYQIRLKGHLGSQWIDWFEGLTITLEEDGDTLLTGPVIDQAALKMFVFSKIFPFINTSNQHQSVYRRYCGAGILPVHLGCFAMKQNKSKNSG